MIILNYFMEYINDLHISLNVRKTDGMFFSKGKKSITATLLEITEEFGLFTSL